jgi:hypothetical protein
VQGLILVKEKRPTDCRLRLCNALFRLVFLAPISPEGPHTGNFFGYTDFMSASPDGTRSAVVTASEQLQPDLNGKVFAALRRAEVLAVCAALAGR